MYRVSLTTLLIDESYYARPLDEQTGNERPGFDAKVFPRKPRPQISDRGAAPAPVSYRYLRNTKSFLVCAVIIIGGRVARLPARLEIGLDQRVCIPRILRREWSRAAA